MKKLFFLSVILLIALSSVYAQNRLKPTLYESCDNAITQAKMDLDKMTIDSTLSVKYYEYYHPPTNSYDKIDSCVQIVLKEAYGIERIKIYQLRVETIKCYNQYITEHLTKKYGRHPITSAYKVAEIVAHIPDEK